MTPNFINNPVTLGTYLFFFSGVVRSTFGLPIEDWVESGLVASVLTAFLDIWIYY
jgi:hypothetical protein